MRTSTGNPLLVLGLTAFALVCLPAPTPVSAGPPAPPVVNPAEWEPMSGVLVRMSAGGVPLALIAEMSQDVEVMTIVLDSAEQTAVASMYAGNGVNMANCAWLFAPANTVLTRDYGPWYVFTGGGAQAIADNVYGNPLDDAIPLALGAALGIPVHQTSLFIQGGNYMSDGMGTGMSDEMVLEQNPGLTPGAIQAIMKSYLGVEPYHVLEDIGSASHVDTWAKLVAPGRVLVKRLDPPNLMLEARAKHLATLMSSYGRPYEVVRIDNTYETGYVNALILNDKVLVPLFNHSLDGPALAAWANALPGYQIIGVPNGGWGPGNALHCRTMGITDRYMLRVAHVPLGDRENDGSAYLVSAEAHAYSNQPLVSGAPTVMWKTVGSPGGFAALAMAHAGGDTFRAYIPQQPDGTEVLYYIEASDASGRTEHHPSIGAGAPHRFAVGPDLTGPTIDVDPPAILLAASWPLALTAEVRDERGVASVDLEYQVNGGPPTSLPMQLRPSSAVVYEAAMAAPAVAPGDRIELRIKAVDISVSQNLTVEPPFGHHSIEVVSGAQACVWNPAGQPSGGVFYDMLVDAGIRCVYASGEPPSFVGFDKLFVFLGLYPSAFALSQSQVAAIAAHVNAGHDVYLEGGDCWAYHPHHDQLGAAFAIQGVSDGGPIANPISGVGRTFTEGMSYSYTHPSSYVDVVQPVGGGAAIFGHAAGTIGVANEASGHRTVGTSFEFASISGQNPLSSQDLLFERILRFFSFSLWTDSSRVEATTGGIVHFTLDAGADHGGRSYVLLGSASGTAPGLALPGGLTLPLAWDAFSGLTWSFANTPVFQGFGGTLDAAGGAAAAFDTLGPVPAAAVGTTFFFAYLLHSPFDFVSTPVAIEIVP